MQPGREAASNSVTGLASRERIRALELAAGLSVLFMIAVHDLWHWGAPDTWTTPIGTVISLLGGPTATPVFLFVMGASLAFSPGARFGTLASRGLWLLFLGYLLNVLRGVLPATIGMATGFVTQQQILPFTPWWLLTSVDLHHVTALTLLALAALRVRSRPDWRWIALAAAVALSEPVLHGLNTGVPILDGPLTPIVGGPPNAVYAVVPWLTYPLIGAVFGRLLVEADDRRRLFRRGALVGIGLMALAGIAIAILGPTFDVQTYWAGPPEFTLGIAGIVLVWLALADAVTRIPAIDRRLGLVYFWSDRVIPMYFVHWLVVGWGIAVVGFRDLPLAGILVATPVAVTVTTLGSRFAIGLEELPSHLWRRFRPGLGPEIGPELGPELAYATEPVTIEP